MWEGNEQRPLQDMKHLHTDLSSVGSILFIYKAQMKSLNILR